MVLGTVAAAGAALTAAYFLRLLRRVTHGAATPAVAQSPTGLTKVELVTWSPLVVLTIALGLLPALVLAMAYEPVGALVAAAGW